MIIFGFGLSFSLGKNKFVTSPIIVDLSEIKITQKTNLPPKIEKEKPKPKEKTKEFTAPKKAEKKQPKIEKKETTIVEKKKVEKKPKPKKEKKKPVPKKESNNELNSLLASIEKLKTETPTPPQTATDKLVKELADTGVKHGIGGNPELEISIGEKDAIASMLKSCWNIDAGAKGVLDMQVGIRATLGRDGNVMEVEIDDSSRYNKDSVFRAIADSARRAVYVCDKRGERSPFKILVKNYPDKYNMWKEIYLQFNPLDGGVF